MVLHAVYVSVGRKEEIWNRWINVLCIKSSFTRIRSNCFNDIEIFDKVILQLWLLDSYWMIMLCSCAYPNVIFVWLFFKFLPMFCSIHKGFCFHQGFLSPISDLTERLLLEERDPPASPQESLYEAPPFDEVSLF